MKTSFPNETRQHQGMDMGMEVEQDAVGLHTKDTAAQAITDLQEFMKLFMPSLPRGTALVSAPSKKIILQGQLTNLGMQCLDIDRLG